MKTMSNASSKLPVALTIAGSDSCGGAGIQADLKTFQALGVYGMSAVTAVTVQNTQKVYDVQEMAPHIVHDQITCLFADIEIQAVKIGMVSSAALIEAIADALGQVQRPPVVLDPVMISKSGYNLLDQNARDTLIQKLFPLAEVVTPNIHEAEAIVGNTITTDVQMRKSAQAIVALGARKVVVKGGHMGGNHATDIVFDGQEFKTVRSERFDTINTHGTGCTFSSAIAAYLARGESFFPAVQKAKHYVTGAIANALDIGQGHGPTHHFHNLYERAGFIP